MFRSVVVFPIPLLILGLFLGAFALLLGGAETFATSVERLVPSRGERERIRMQDHCLLDRAVVVNDDCTVAGQRNLLAVSGNASVTAKTPAQSYPVNQKEDAE